MRACDIVQLTTKQHEEKKMLNISLHDPKDAKTHLLRTSHGPFSCVTISCAGGGTADVYSLSPEDLAKIGKAFMDASVHLKEAIDNDKEETE